MYNSSRNPSHEEMHTNLFCTQGSSAGSKTSQHQLYKLGANTEKTRTEFLARAV